MLKYKCLLCGIEWGDPRASESDISHGYCPTCIRKQYTSRIHRAQREAGSSDCFNRGHNDSAEHACCFRNSMSRGFGKKLEKGNHSRRRRGGTRRIDLRCCDRISIA